MAITLGFDVYGTLIDTAGVTAALKPFTGNLAPLSPISGVKNNRNTLSGAV